MTTKRTERGQVRARVPAVSALNENGGISVHVRLLSAFVAVAIGGLLLTSCETSSDAASKTVLAKAYATCTDQSKASDSLEEGEKVGDALEIADEGATLIIQTEGESDYAGYFDYLCVVGELGTSERIKSSIGNTTSMMGRQTAEEDGLSYEYSYHPDNGLYVLIAEQ